MPGAVSPEAREARAALGAAIRLARGEAGLNQRQLADAADIGKSTMSRIETGEQRADDDELGRIMDALSAGAELRNRLRDLARDALRTGLNLPVSVIHRPADERQQIVLADEANAGLIRVYQANLVPGLLQTSNYARRVLRLTGAGDRLGPAVSFRLQRQEILSDPAHEFHFVITEGALRWHPAPGPGDTSMPHLLRQQVDQIASVATLPNVHLTVILADAPMLLVPPASFLLHERRAGGMGDKAIVEIPSDRLIIEKPDDVALYQEALEMLARSGVSGPVAIRALHQIAASLGRRPQQQ